MRGFLKNLASKGRGAVPRLEPRRPAPYEGLPDSPVPDSPVPDSPVPDSLEPLPQTSAPLTRPSVPQSSPSSSTVPAAPVVPAAPAALPEPAIVIPASPNRPTPANTTLKSNSVSPTPTPVAAAPSATPVAAPGVARRMAAAAPNTPPPPAPASLPSTQTHQLRPAEKAVPSSSGAIERAAPVQSPENSVLPNIETLRPAKGPPQMPPVNKAERSVPSSPKQLEPAPLPLLQGEVQVSRPVTQSPAHPPDNAAPTTEAPVVEVHIGTIEVVAAQPQPPVAPQRVEAQPRGISLDDFLDGRGRQ